LEEGGVEGGSGGDVGDGEDDAVEVHGGDFRGRERGWKYQED
jgi:hypothetical protein